MKNVKTRTQAPHIKTHSFTLFYEINFAPLLYVFYIEQISGTNSPLVFLTYPKPITSAIIEHD